jgi:hypothetical protein
MLDQKKHALPLSGCHLLVVSPPDPPPPPLHLAHSFVQPEIQSVGGFDGYFFRSFATPGATAGVTIVTSSSGALPRLQLCQPVYHALLEIALDCLTRPSDAPGAFAVETFGKLLVRPQLLRPILRAIPVSDSWQTRHDIMKVSRRVSWTEQQEF